MDLSKTTSIGLAGLIGGYGLSLIMLGIIAITHGGPTTDTIVQVLEYVVMATVGGITGVGVTHVIVSAPQASAAPAPQPAPQVAEPEPVPVAPTYGGR